MSADTMPRVAGVIGYPLGHTLSPALQQAAFDHYRLGLCYEVWETPPESLDERVASLRRATVLGANVTVPHKQAVIPLLDEVDCETAFVGAVNTITNRSGRLCGCNTDVPGFLRALRVHAGFEPRGTATVLLGSGGAARAVAYALVREGARSLLIANRRPERAEALARDLTPLGRATAVAVAPWGSPGVVDALTVCDLVVNATTLGMWHGPASGECPPGVEHISARATAFDLVYNPAETPFLSSARKAGALAVGGLAMLVYQGAESFQIWTGLEAPVAAMMAAAQQGLRSLGQANA